MPIAIRRHLTPDDRAAEPYLDVPFEVPAGTPAVEVELRYDTDAGVIDIGCEGPDGWRGWSGGARQRFVVGHHESTWGYLAGELESGEWRVVLGLHRVGAAGVPIELDIHVPAVRTVEPDPPAPVPTERISAAAVRALPAPDGLTWWACDLHSHTLHSDGALSVRQLAAEASTAGLDALAITDHNTISTHRSLPAASAEYGVQLIAGQEITTDRGHANAFGELPFIDFRRHPDQWVADVTAHGGILSINHPVATDCAWQWELGERPRFAEVMHSSWGLAPAHTAIWAWAGAWGADGLVPLGGSDFHRYGQGVTPGRPTTWVAADNPTPAAILAGVAAGRTALSAGAPLTGPVLLRVGDDLLAIGADGAVHSDRDGRAQVIHGDVVTINATLSGGLHRLTAADGAILAVSA